MTLDRLEQRLDDHGKRIGRIEKWLVALTVAGFLPKLTGGPSADQLITGAVRFLTHA